MTKAEFTDRVAAKSGLSKRDATKAVDAFLDSITDALRSGEQVSFTGFGKFSPQHRKERQGKRVPRESIADAWRLHARAKARSRRGDASFRRCICANITALPRQGLGRGFWRPTRPTPCRTPPPRSP